MSFRFDDNLRRGTSFRSSGPATPQAGAKGRALGSLPSFGDLLRLLPDPPKSACRVLWRGVFCLLSFVPPSDAK
jgi:hypothetical protein